MVEKTLYICLDAARMGTKMEKAKTLSPSNYSLYKEIKDEYLAMLAPHFFFFNNENDFDKWYLSNGWGKSWGILINAPQKSFDYSVNHFEKFLKPKNQNGGEFLFRFYDPRVLRKYLPGCNSQQLKEFFGPIQQFICEDEDPTFALIFSFNGTTLITERAKAELFFSSFKESNNGIVSSTTDKKNADNEIQEQKKAPRRFFY